MNKDLKINSKKQDPTFIELVWDDKQDLIELKNEVKFTNFILKESYKSVKKAIENNLSKIELFNIYNLCILVEVKKSNYSSILEKAEELYIEEENYEECSKIKNLKKKINEKV
jgi:hypothetical protein